MVPPKHSFGFEPLSKFKKGAKVLYYAGPHHTGINGKWRQKWTGPWHIAYKTSKFRVKIVDNTGRGYDVDIDRLKLFKQMKSELLNHSQYEQTLKKLQKNTPIYSDED